MKTIIFAVIALIALAQPATAHPRCHTHHGVAHCH